MNDGASMLVHDFLERQAARQPNSTALVCGDRRIAYGELEGLANRVAHGLQDRGVRRGDRVAILLGNSVEAVAAILGTLKANATFVALNTQTKYEKLAYMLKHSEATALLMERRLARPGVVSSLRRDVPSLEHVVLCRASGAAPGQPNEETLSWSDLIENQPAAPPPRAAIDLDLACLIYTSGTTAEPKGVMCDHSAMVFATGSIAEYLQHTSNDVLLSALPLSYSYGLYQLLVTLAMGGRLVLEENFAFPMQTLKKFGTEGVTGFAGVPTIFSLLLSLKLDDFDLSPLRYVTNAAAALPSEHLNRLRTQLPHVAVFCMHGLTETVRTVFLPPGELDARPGSVGRAIPGTEVWLEDDTGRRVGAGEVGEMVVRGRHVMRGYLNDAAATAARFRAASLPGERLCYTGDLFRMDSDGYMYFVGRKDDIIKTRGEKVSPEEVENALYALEGVKAAAAVGVPDDLLGQVVKAFVVLEPGPTYTPAQVIAHCKRRLEDFAVPRLVEFRDALPQTPTGKVRRAELR